MKVDDYETEYSEDGYFVTVKYKGDVILEWDNSASFNYPEDITWSRMIANVFHSGVNLGARIQKDNS